MVIAFVKKKKKKNNYQERIKSSRSGIDFIFADILN